MYCNWSFSYRSILFTWQFIASHHLIPIACSKSIANDRHEHFSPLSSMAERLSGGRGSVKCEAAAGGGALAPHLTEPRPPDTIAARRQGADYVTVVVVPSSS